MHLHIIELKNASAACFRRVERVLQPHGLWLEAVPSKPRKACVTGSAVDAPYARDADRVARVALANCADVVG